MLLQHVSAQDITFRHLTPDDGLSQISVNALYCDELGFVWIGTREGLNCYNSNGIRVFKWHKDDPNSLFYNAVQRIVGDKAGNLYLLCSEGIARYDSTRDKFSTLLQGNVSAFCYENGLFVARGTGIYRCDTTTGELSLLCELPPAGNKVTEITWMLRDSRDTWWIGTNAGLFGYTPDNGFICPLADCNVTHIYEDSRQTLWIGTWNQGCYFRTAEGRWDNLRASDQGLLSDFVRCFTEDSSGKIWIGTFLGLNCFDPEQGLMKSYTSDGSAGALSHNSIWAMICDRQGTVWVGTYFGGVNFFNPEYEIFTRYGTSDKICEGLSSTIVGKIVEDESHDLWICTEGGGLNMLDRRTGKFRHYRHSNDSNSLSHDNVKAVCIDPERGAAWIGTHLGGLNRLDLKTNRFTHYRFTPGNPRTIPSDIVRDIVLHDQKLIIATQEGVCEFNPDTGEARQLFQDPPGNLIRAVSSLLVDARGTLWIAATGKGLYAYHFDTKTLTNYRHDPDRPHSLSCDNINCIRLDGAGNLWIATSGAGLDRFRYESGDFENYDSAHNGLSSDCIYDIIDVDGRLYVITNDGLSVFDRTEAASARFRNFRLSDGFPLNGNTICRTYDGQLFIGGTQGMISFDPDKLNISPKPYEIVFSRLIVDGHPVEVGDESGILDRSLSSTQRIVLKPRYSVFGIEFATSNFVPFKDEKLVYRLEGFSDTWMPTRGQHEIIWTNLNPGTYTLVVRSADGRSDTPEARLGIRILPPFYRTTWAWILYVLVGLTLFCLFMRVYHNHIRLQESLRYEQQHIRDVEALNQSKLRFFTNISHEFRTPLTLILGHAEMLLSAHSMAPSIYNKVLQIYKNSLQLKELIGELLDFRKQEQGHMKIYVSEQDLVAFLYENYLLFEEYASRKRIHLVFEHSADTLMVWFDRTQMQKVVSNLLSNAFKYTGAEGSITLWVRRTDSCAEFGVTDTGAGMTQDDAARIFDRFYQGANSDRASQGTGIGLALAKGIVSLHHGTIRVDSRLNVGTTFSVSLPLGRDCFTDEEVASTTDLTSTLLPAVPRLPEEVPVPDDENAAIGDRIKGSRMLIVEDNEALRNMLVQLCEPLYEILTASDGEEGWEKVLSENPQIVLSDVVMPRMSGTELCRRIKKDINTCHIPVILLTARTALEHNLEGLRNGADDYVTKPFNAELLLSRCNNLVNSRIILQEKFSRQPGPSALMLATNAYDKEFIDQALTVIRKHMDDSEFNVALFSREMGMARTNLFKKIKAITGSTPNDFIQTVRLKAAVTLLEEHPEMSIAEIADRTGFSSAHYFSKCFKQQFNTSPMAFRKSRRTGSE